MLLRNFGPPARIESWDGILKRDGTGTPLSFAALGFVLQKRVSTSVGKNVANSTQVVFANRLLPNI